MATGAICVCILTWHFCVAESSLHGWQAWVALGAVAPYVAMTALKGKGSARSAFLGWFAAIGSVVSLFGLVQNQVFNNGGLLLFGLAALFSAFHVWGSLAASPEQAAWRSPFRTAGAIGAGILLVLMSFDVWSNSGFLSGAIGFSVLCYLLLAGCLAGIALLILKKRPLEISFGLVGPLVFGALLLATPLSKSQGDVEFLLETLFSIATFALGVYSMLLGIKSDSFGSLNGGILLIFLWLMARFFMSDLDFLFKGLLFICLGAAFIAFNVFFFLRRRKALGKEVAQ